MLSEQICPMQYVAISREMYNSAEETDKAGSGKVRGKKIKLTIDGS